MHDTFIILSLLNFSRKRFAQKVLLLAGVAPAEELGDVALLSMHQRHAILEMKTMLVLGNHQ